MANFSFKMQLKLGHEVEYQRRHDAIWPELLELLKNAGISNYSIHLDGSSNKSFDGSTTNGTYHAALVELYGRHHGDWSGQ